MKKRDLATLAMIGISAGLMLGGCQTNNGNKPSGNKASAAEQLSPDVQAFYNSLSSDAQQKFLQMDAQHRMMAMEMTHQTCSGKNSCKGMGGCKTASHACAGQNGCKGQGGEPVKDANKAVSIQYNNQTGQRQNANSGLNTSNPNTTTPNANKANPNSSK